eukprot:1160001-Pelagomonas_calceolata.AAC.5
MTQPARQRPIRVPWVLMDKENPAYMSATWDNSKLETLGKGRSSINQTSTGRGQEGREEGPRMETNVP